MIPFSPPRIDDKTVAAVTEALRSGWITTGPKTKQFEKELTAYCGNKVTVALGSATAGLELALRWFGVGPGDEVIIPAYTYCATANVIMHCGATPVMVDVKPYDFNIDPAKVKKAITSRTKVIMPVDMAGYPCDYDQLKHLLETHEAKQLFTANTPVQEKLGRILLLADAAHSFGASMLGKQSGALADINCFSFHAVKNLTTAEGGALAFNLPDVFDHEALYREFCIKSLHGQSKDALSKTKAGGWRYDVLEAGYKCNMTDIQAAIGLVELERYDHDTLKRRKAIVARYTQAFARHHWAELPPFESESKQSSYHLFLLRIKGISEAQRDAIIDKIFEKQVSVNVHFIPLPMLSFYKEQGYDISNYPVVYDNFSREITLPVYYDLSDEDISTVVAAVESAVREVLG